MQGDSMIQHFQDSIMYLSKPFLIMYYCTVIYIFMIKNTLLTIISSILFRTPLFKNGGFVLRLKYATHIFHSWEEFNYWGGCPISVIRPCIITCVNQEIIFTNMNSKFNEYVDTIRKGLGAQ